MIINLKKNIFFRGFSCEVFAEKYLRKKNKNSFIFRTNRFANLDVLEDYYKLNFCNVENLALIRSYYKSIDVIEFKLKDYKSKVVEDINLYEVKSRIFSRNRPIDISIKGYNRFIELGNSGFGTKLVLITLLNDWKFDIDIYEYNKFKNICLRKKRFLFTNKKDIYTDN